MIKVNLVKKQINTYIFNNRLHQKAFSNKKYYKSVK